MILKGGFNQPEIVLSGSSVTIAYPPKSTESLKIEIVDGNSLRTSFANDSLNSRIVLILIDGIVVWPE